MASEAAYPYKQALGTCPSSYTKFFQGKIADLSVTRQVDITRYVLHNTAGASITGGYWTQQGGEDLLKKLVAEHGAVMTGVAAAGPFSEYKVSCDWSRPRSADP